MTKMKIEVYQCEVCKEPIFGAMVGAGNGNGDSFVHRECQDEIIVGKMSIRILKRCETAISELRKLSQDYFKKGDFDSYNRIISKIEGISLVLSYNMEYVDKEYLSLSF